jgi:deoxyribonuclease-4
VLAGCHVSIREGYYGAAKTAHQLGANAFQYFPKNPRSLSVKEFNKQDALFCKDFCQENGLVSVAHTPYPTSLTPSEEKRKITIQSLLNDLEISEACGSIGVVVHFGDQIDPQHPLQAYELMISVLNEVLEQWSGEPLLLIENIAGKPGKMGTTIEEHIQVRNLCDYPERIGFCFDTCHAFASGVWTGDNTDQFIQRSNELGYFANLKVIHLNNSKYEQELGIDRHANIMTGKIHSDYIKKFLRVNKVRSLPFILETPGDDHKQEIQDIRELQGSKGMG